MLYIILYIVISLLCISYFSSYKPLGTGKVAVIIATLAVIVGFSDMLGGYDRYIYGELFDRNADLIRAGGPFINPDSPIMGYHSELAYVFWNSFVAYITPNRYIYILFTTIFIYTLLFISFRKMFMEYPISILLFMGLWFFFTFTYLRQAMAAGCTWLGYRYVIKRDLIRFLIVGFIAYKFHNSAIIYFLFYFMPQKKWDKKVIIIVLVLLLIIGASGLPMSLYNVYGDAADSQRSMSYADDHPGFRYDYLFEVVILMYFIFNRYDKIPEDREHITYLNAALMFCFILFAFIQSSNSGRQSWYYIMGMIYTLSFLATQGEGFDQYAKMLYLVATLLFLRFVFNWGILISPYKTFLTKGHRQNDPVFQSFEYDEKYDDNKFYRPAFEIKMP